MCSIENPISMEGEADNSQKLLVKWHKAMKTATEAQILLQEVMSEMSGLLSTECQCRNDNKKHNIGQYNNKKIKHKYKINESDSSATSSSYCDSEIEIISCHRTALDEHKRQQHHSGHHGRRNRSHSRGHDRKRDRSRSRGRSRGHSRGHSRGRSRGHSRDHSRGRSCGYSATRNFPSRKSSHSCTHSIENRLPMALTI
ncbi:serine/threonine-protein kinase fray2-like [Musca vetustissima]|uniref:serine/threonine-protein kinase fray2-like n=1 Tax=Musca vetustissima TaxID=27455 RepID=UPI002AB6F58F|nr:serine/threonine-protein kinase fray2-like [Musca vetustissima]